MKLVKSTAFLLALIVSVGSAGYAETKKTTQKAAKAGETLKVDAANSEIKWVGKKVTGQHNGTVNVKSGELQVADGTVTGGTVVIDMPTIKVLDLTDPGSNAKLTGHLKSDDFFGVDKHPTATFKINQVRAVTAAGEDKATHEVAGDLTIKGVTKPVSFPAKIEMHDGMVHASANAIPIDRTLYDIRYGSGKFFQNLGDKMIDDRFLIDFHLMAKK